MPYYEYECQACCHHFELFQKITDAATAPCPKCEATETKRLISRTSFSLKGGGWYKDGYGTQGKTGQDKQDKKEGAAGADTQSTDTSTTDKKPACKAGCGCHSGKS